VGAAAPFWMFGINDIGPGHDLYLATRFVGLDSPDFNLPIVQSGTVASLPLLRIPNQFEEPCFLIETHSRLGYSGAPVFAYLSPEDDQLSPKPIVALGAVTAPNLFLLGVFSQHISTFEQVVDKPSREGKPVFGRWVRTPSALGAVVPAWEILEILQGDVAMARRKEVEQTWAEEGAEEPPSIETEPAYSEPDPSSIEATQELLGKLLQVPKDETED
jgi:uncharacterized cupin superfamily protein